MNLWRLHRGTVGERWGRNQYFGLSEMSLAQNGAMVIRPINKKGYSRKGDFINKNLAKWTIEASPRIMRWLEVFSICAELMVSKTWLDSKVYLRKISLNSNLRH